MESLGRGADYYMSAIINYQHSDREEFLDELASSLLKTHEELIKRIDKFLVHEEIKTIDLSKVEYRIDRP